MESWDDFLNESDGRGSYKYYKTNLCSNFANWQSQSGRKSRRITWTDMKPNLGCGWLGKRASFVHQQIVWHTRVMKNELNIVFFHLFVCLSLRPLEAFVNKLGRVFSLSLGSFSTSVSVYRCFCRTPEKISICRMNANVIALIYFHQMLFLLSLFNLNCRQNWLV